jgi:hypothetical protein
MKILRTRRGFADRGARRNATSALLLIAVCVLSVALMENFLISPLAAQETDDSSCLTCHGNAGLTTVLPGGEIVNVGVNADEFHASIHGRNGIGCRDCHSNITGYPHPPLEFESYRAYAISRNGTCNQCHQDIAARLEGSAHVIAISEGNLSAAVCTDCHGSHNTRPLREQPIQVSHTCQGCHSEIYARYERSVHGAALIGEGNPDVPNCIDCHGAHHVLGPMNAPFRLDSYKTCARCHADRELMAKYSISPNTVRAWMNDFHGKVVVLTDEINPGRDTDKATCIDCHGVHDMLTTEDPGSAVSPERILSTCQKCHPEATNKFTGAFLDHQEPSTSDYPVVFYVKWFYYLIIPFIIGGMFVFVVTDYIRQIIDLRKERRNG